MEIKVLMTKGCASCNAFYETVKCAIEELHLNVTLVKEDNLMGILAYHTPNLPALIIQEKVIIYGKKLSINDMKKLLTLELQKIEK